jgi:hypothetical protein
MVAAATVGCGAGLLALHGAEAGSARANADPTLTVAIQAGSGTVSSSPAGINCPPTCSAMFPAGTMITLTATPAADFRFDAWASSAGCTIQPDTPNQCRITMGAGNKTVGVVFRPAATMHVFPNGDGTITVSPAGIDLADGSTTTTCASAGNADGCRLAYVPGTRVTGTATPAAGRAFASWGDASCGTGPCTVEAVAGESSLVANFNPLRLEVRVSGAGVVTSSPAGIVCGNGQLDCDAVASLGSTFVLDAGTQPHEWKFGCEPEGGNPAAPRCTAMVAAGPTVAGVSFGGAGGPAEPSRISIRLDLVKTGGAAAAVVGRRIECRQPLCTATYKFGDTEELQPVDGAGARFRRWVNGCGTTRVCRFPVGPITSLEAVFTPPLAASLVSAKATGRGAKRVVVARVKVNVAASVALRLQRNGRRVTGRSFAVKPGQTSLRLSVPRRAPAGRYRIVGVVRADTEQRRVARLVRVGR